MWKRVNPNPCRAEEPDCVVRAIAIATGQSWDRVHWELCVLSHWRCTMPSVNWLWGSYLRMKGFRKFSMPEECPECVSVRMFCRMYPKGTYVIGTGTHAVCVIDGDYYDTGDSGDEIPQYFWKKERG